MEIIVKDLEQTKKLSQLLGYKLDEGCIITLAGDLGAGKTTFTQGLAKAIGIQGVVSSPTFTILKEYSGNYNLAHFDAYRLEGSDEDLGFEEIFERGDICVIEWANFIADIIPENRLEITILKLDENARKFIFNPIGEKYQKICEEIKNDNINS